MAEIARISRSQHNDKHLIKQMVLNKPIDFKPLFTTSEASLTIKLQPLISKDHLLEPEQ